MHTSPHQDRHDDASARTATERATVLMLTVPVGLYLVVLFFFFLLPSWKARAASTWPSVPCHVNSIACTSRASTQGELTYRIHVSYTYRVDGHDYTSTRFTFHRNPEDHREHLDAMVDLWKANPHPTCRVNPTRPHDAVLDPDYVPEATTGDFILLMSPMALVGLLVLFAVRHLRTQMRAMGASPAPPRTKP